MAAARHWRCRLSRHNGEASTSQCLKVIARTMEVSMLWSAVWFMALRVQASPLVLVYRIEEDCQLGTLLADIKTDSRLSEHYNRTVIDQLRLAMLATQSDVDSRRHFDFDEVTGQVRAATSLDRDDICPAAVDCILKVDFAVQPAAYFRLIKVNNFCSCHIVQELGAICQKSTSESPCPKSR